MDLLTLENLFTLLALIVLQAVLGFDNLLYISLASKNAPEEKQAYVRKVGIVLAIFLRIGLLFILTKMMALFEEPWISVHWKGVFEGEFNFDSLLTLAGGAFIIYTAIKEIMHMMTLEEDGKKEVNKTSVGKVITMIVIMNLVFSFDSILSAMALSDVFVVMAIAIVISGILMIWMSDTVSKFLQKNRLYEVLGLFILFVVGIMLVTSGGEHAELVLFGEKVEEMSKTTFYFVLIVLVLVDIVQGRYQKKLNKEK